MPARRGWAIVAAFAAGLIVSGLGTALAELPARTDRNADYASALQEQVRSLGAEPIPKDGENGSDGKDGASGRDGRDGRDGETVVVQVPTTGVQGAQGTDGTDSTTPGPAGPSGPAGPAGPEGPTGPAGRDGLNGTNGMDGLPPAQWTFTIPGIGEFDCRRQPDLSTSCTLTGAEG